MSDDNDNDSDHSFTQLPQHNAPARPKGQKLAKELRSMQKIINPWCSVQISCRLK